MYQQTHFKILIQFISVIFSLLCIGIIGFILYESLPFIKYTITNYNSIHFGSTWNPLESKFNFLPMIVGTLLSALGGLILSMSLGLFLAIYSQYYCYKYLKIPIKIFNQIFSSVPSVIFGFWAIVFLVPVFVEKFPPGTNLLTAQIILGLMFFPIVFISFSSLLESKNDLFLQGKLLNFTKEKIILKIILPSLSKSIIEVGLLTISRCMGETMAMVMVCGNVVQIPKSLFDPFRTLSGNIVLEMSYAINVHKSSLFFSGFLLLLLVSFLYFLTSKLIKIVFKVELQNDSI